MQDDGLRRAGDMTASEFEPATSRREEFLDDLTRPGIETVTASPSVMPDRRSWVSRCAAVVRTGSVSEADALAALLEDGHEVAEAFRMEQYWPGERGAGENESGGPRISAAWAVLDVVYAVQDEARAQDWLSDAQARWHRACVLPGGSVPLPVEASGAAGMQPVGRILGALMNDPAVGYARLMLQVLSGTLPSCSDRVHVAAVFGGPEDGAHGKLTLAIQPGGPPGLYPDPRSMAFLAADEGFAESLSLAWQTAPEEIRNRCVVWDVSDDERPVRVLGGGSLGAAFGVGLDELAHAIRPLGAARVRRLDPRCAVTGRLDRDGHLLPVGDYEPKFRAARRQRWRMVVPKNDPEAIKHPDIPVRVDYAPDLRTAIRKSRLLRLRPHGIIVMTVALIVAATMTAAAIVAHHDADTVHARQVAAQLAGNSGRLLSTNLPVAQLLAVEAYHLDQDPQTLTALFQAVTFSPALVRYLQAGSPVSAISGSSDGRSVAAGTSDGQVVRWNLTGGPGATIASLDGAITAVALNADGTVVAAATTSKVTVWTTAGGARQVLLPGHGSIRAIAVSPSGRYVAVVNNYVTLLDRKKNTARVAATVSSAYAVGIPSNTRLVIAAGGGPWQVLSLPGLANVLGPTTLSTGVHQVVQALSANGRFVGYSNGSATIPLWHTASRSTQPALTGLSHGSDPQALSISPDGKRIAVADGGTIYVSDTSHRTPNSTSQLSLPGNSSTTAVQFLGDDEHLLSATGSSLALWDLNHPGRIGTRIQVKAPYVCEACPPPQTDVSPNGRLAATLAGNPSTLYVHDLSPGGSQYSFPGGPPVSYQLLGWDSRSSKIFFMSADGHTLEAAQVGNGIRIVERRRIPISDYEILAFSQAGKQLIEISNSGSIQIVPLVGTGREVTIPSPNHPDGYSLIESMVDPTSSYLTEQFESDKAVDVDVRLIDLKTGHVRDLGSGNVPGSTFSGGYLLVQRANADIEAWDAAGTAMRYLIREDQSYMPNSASAQTSPVAVGSFLVQERSDGTLAVTQLNSGALLGELPAPSSLPLLKTGLSTDGADQLVSVMEGPPASDEGTLVRWDLSPQSWTRDACVTAGRSLTSADWQQYATGPLPAFRACENSS